MRRPTHRRDLRLPLFVLLAGVAGLRAGAAAPAAPALALPAVSAEPAAATGPLTRAAFSVG